MPGHGVKLSSAFSLMPGGKALYSGREQAALARIEAVTLITNGHVPDKLHEEVRKQFSDVEVVNLTLAIVVQSTDGIV